MTDVIRLDHAAICLAEDGAEGGRRIRGAADDGRCFRESCEDSRRALKEDCLELEPVVDLIGGFSLVKSSFNRVASLLLARGGALYCAPGLTLCPTLEIMCSSSLR